MDDLVTEEVADEVIVYDERTDVACRLNRSAALVWQKCDGKHTLADLVAALKVDMGDVADEDLVLVALDSLDEHGLIESGYESRDATASRLSRRPDPAGSPDRRSSSQRAPRISLILQPRSHKCNPGRTG